MSEKRNRSGVCPLGDSLFNNSLQELEGELVADSELDYAVLVAIVTVLVYFGHTQIVTKVENCLLILKRKAEGNRQVESLALILEVNVFGLSCTNTVNLMLGT